MLTYMPISKKMNTYDSMAELYNLIEKLEGSLEAKKLILSIVNTSISEIQYEGLAFSKEEFESRVAITLNDFLEVARKTNAA